MLGKFTIKWKLISINMLVSMVALALASAVFLGYRVIDLRQTMITNHKTQAGILANSVVYALSFNDSHDATTILAELHWRQTIDFAAVYKSNGQLFAQYRSADLPADFDVPTPSEKDHFFESGRLILFHPVFFHNEQIGTVCLATNTSPMHRAFRETLLVVLLVFIASLSIAFLLAHRMQAVISGPLLELARVAKIVALKKDYTAQVPERGDDELGMLVHEFNQMLSRIRARDMALVEAKERLERNSHELAQHRDHLERLVEERTAHLRSAYEEIRAFVFMFSHDLRTPLVNIKGFTGELRFNFRKLERVTRDYLDQLEPAHRKELLAIMDEDIPEALSFVESSATNMDRLINAILKLSFLGRRELKFEQVNVAFILDKVVKNLGHRAEQMGAELVVGDLPDVVADATSLEQILENIMANALSYLDENRPGKVQVWGEQGEDVVFFYVRDNGRGIEAGDIPKVFEPFRRVGSQGKDIQGQGMGMVYAKTLVGRHGGKIWCISKVNQGTTFTFTIAKDPDKRPAYSPLGT